MINTLNTINNYTHLHGILILLRPYNSRLTVIFRFIIQELLTHFHRDAAKNIVVGFTMTRGTGYAPGEAMPPLLELFSEHNLKDTLKKNTTYCFDSESFRYLAACKSGVTLPGSVVDFSRSWDKSFLEAFRMIEYIASLEPHSIKSTESLNAARKLITHLTIPKAESYREDQMQMAIAKFGFYLKYNSIIPYNDVRIDYIRHQIRQEENKLSVLKWEQTPGGEEAQRRIEKLIDNLKAMMASYKEYEKILQKAIDKGDANANPADKPLSTPYDIMREVARLYGLKSFGRKFEEYI